MRRLFHPSVVIWLLSLLLCTFIVSRTHFVTDMSAFLPSHPSVEQQLLVDQLQSGSVSRTFLMGIEGGSADERAQLSHVLASHLRKDSGFLIVRNGEPDTDASGNKLLFDYRYLLSPNVNTVRFTPNGLQTAISDTIDTLNSPLGDVVKKTFLHDPTGEMLDILGEFDGQNTIPEIGGAWSSQDGHRAILIAQSKAGGGNTDALQTNVQSIQTDYALAVRTTGVKGTHLLISGAPMFAVNARATIQREVKILSTLSMIVIVVLLFLVYRSMSTLLLSLLPVLSGVLAGITAVSLVFGSVHGITVGFGTTLIGEAVDYTIYYFVQSQQLKQTNNSWVKLFWPTIRLGVLTSVCGFSSLLFSSFPGLAQIGLYSIIGLLTAAAVTRFILPQLCPVNPKMLDTTSIGLHLAQVVTRITQWRLAIYVLLILSIALVIFHPQKIWRNGLTGLSMATQKQQDTDAQLRADLGAPEMRYLLAVSAHSQEQVLQIAEQVSLQMQHLLTQGVIASFDTPTRFLPSIRTQQQRLNSIPEAPELYHNLQIAVRGLPISATHLDGFIVDVEHTKQLPLISNQLLQGTNLGMATDAMLMQGKYTWTALLPIRTVSADQFNPVIVNNALLQAGIPHAKLLDILQQSKQIYAGYLHEVMFNSFLGLVGIVLLLVLTLHSAVRLWQVLFPVLAAVLFVVSGLILIGNHLSLFHLIGMLLIVAIGSNYALFFDRYHRSTSLEPHTLTSLLFANLTTVMAFGVLAFSNVPVLHDIGITVAPGASLALILSAIFSPRTVLSVKKANL